MYFPLGQMAMVNLLIISSMENTPGKIWVNATPFAFPGEDGPSQGAGAPGAGRSGQCVTSADCASRVPYCSKLGFCHGGRLPFDEEQLEIEDGVFASPPQDQPQGYINNNPRKNSPIFQNEQRQPKKQKQQQRNKATNSNGRRSSSNNSNSNNNNKGSSSRRNNNNSRNDNSSRGSSLGRGRQGTTNQERRRNNNNTGRKSSKAGSVRARLQQQTKSNGNAQGAGCPGNRLAACEGACSQLEGISAKAYRLCNQECRERCQ